MNKVRSFRYRVVDVFTKVPLEGNPLAVFPDASGIDEASMQKIAKELNLSETTFIFPANRPDCVASVRIFTPKQELDFAGHPTIGTSFVMMDEGTVPKEINEFLLEEKVGPIPIRVEWQDRPIIWLRTPTIRFGKYFDRAIAASVLHLDIADLLDVTPQLITAGNPTVFVAVRGKSAVDQAAVDSAGERVLRDDAEGPGCVFVFTPTPEGAYSRMFAPEYGIVEDPATGSATGPLAAYMIRNGLVSGADGTEFVSEQGTMMGRRSFLRVLIRGRNGQEGIEVGGYVTPVIEAALNF